MSADNEPGNQLQTGEGSNPRGGRRRLLVKLLVLAGILAAFGYVYVEHRDELTLQAIAERESQFRTFQDEHPVGVFVVAFVIYVAVTGLSVPGATVLTLAYGWFFGFWSALVLVSFASTGGATMAFFLSRYLLRDTIRRRFGVRLKKFEESLEKEGAYYLFSLRLIPQVPFFVINVVMGLTPIRVWTFWWVSQVGMLAGTCVYVYVGTRLAEIPNFAERDISDILKNELSEFAQLLLAFALLGLFPLIVRKLMARFRSTVASADGTGKDADQTR